MTLKANRLVNPITPQRPDWAAETAKHMHRFDANARSDLRCAIYNVTTAQQAIIEWARAMRDHAGNVPPTIDVYPNYSAPVVGNAPDGVRELAMLQWSKPTPPQHLTASAIAVDLAERAIQ